ncbi:MAG: antibiotic biosynthesis monooxygenase [Oscillospiraceae bacterium]|nr:antibiotic biosynthesis monooxygenase [Oscillospiraceae bacterium]
MVTIVAKNVVKPGTAEAFIAAAQPLIAGSRTEAGCIAYDLYVDLSDPNVLTFIEQWQDEAAIAAHNASAHFTAIVPELGKFAAGEMDVRLYKI